MTKKTIITFTLLLSFSYFSIAQLKVMPSGVVGIGTNSPLQNPNYRLDIFGDAILTNSGRLLIGSENRYLGLGVNSDLTLGNTTNNSLRIGSNNGIMFWSSGGFDNSTASNSNDPDMVIYQNGYTKIGANSNILTTKLEINGDGLISRDGRLFFTLQKGYLGIMNTSKDLSLVSYYPSRWLRIGSIGGVAIWGRTGFEDMQSSIYQKPDLFVDNNGNVGINGLPSASYKFNVDKGNSNFNGDIFVFNHWTLSDKRVKKNIAPIENAIEIITKLNGRKFEYINNDEKHVFDVGQMSGLIAQEVKEILPNMVKEREDGLLAINYSYIIPYLIEGIKEQSEKIKILESELKICCNKKVNKVTEKYVNFENEIDSANDAILFQNAPNPFSINTHIRFVIPNRIQNSYIGVYNLNGVLIKSYNIKQRGKGEIIINGKELVAGMYLYTLMADGEEVDTKKMILTE